MTKAFILLRNLRTSRHLNLLSTRPKFAPLNSPLKYSSRLFTNSNKLYQTQLTEDKSETISPVPKAASIVISDEAVKQIKHIQARDKNPNQTLKVVIESGGCHGFKLLFDLNDELDEDDILFEKDGAKVAVNKAFLPLIAGSTVDFAQELIGSNFKLLDNPNAASGCGCGISFELK